MQAGYHAETTVEYDRKAFDVPDRRLHDIDWMHFVNSPEFPQHARGITPEMRWNPHSARSWRLLAAFDHSVNPHQPDPRHAPPGIRVQLNFQSRSAAGETPTRTMIG